MSPVEFVVRPIGIVRSPFREKVDAPRQAVAAPDAEGTIELLPAYRDALDDLEGFDRIWLLFWFDRAYEPGATFHPKVLPPRSTEKRGVFATRSPHRPNPLGLSAVRLLHVDKERCAIHVRELDVLDGTPVVDVKPYIAYADAFGDARAGWLDAKDPIATWTVRFAPAAEEALAWVEAQPLPDVVADLRARVTAALALGPTPHAYRRIRKADDGTLVLAVKTWRVAFRVDGQTLIVERIASGFRPRELSAPARVHPRFPAGDPDAIAHAERTRELHRAFVARFG